MLYIRLENSIPVEVSSEYPKAAEKEQGPKMWAMQPKTPGNYHDMVNTGNGWISRSDIKTFAYANTLATLLTEKLGKTFLASDAGHGVSPRYDVIEAPKLGDEVSRSFNGDTYPCGTIVKITPTWQITTSDGTKFRRFKETAGWRQTGRGFWMTGGHRYEQNPSY